MISGGLVQKSSFSPEVLGLVRAFQSNDNSSNGLQGIARAAAQSHLPEVRQAALQVLKGPSDAKGALQRSAAKYAAKAPQSISIPREKVLGDFFARLASSEKPEVRQFREEFAAAWFKLVAGQIGIYGKHKP